MALVWYPGVELFPYFGVDGPGNRLVTAKGFTTFSEKRQVFRSCSSEARQTASKLLPGDEELVPERSSPPSLGEDSGALQPGFASLRTKAFLARKGPPRLGFFFLGEISEILAELASMGENHMKGLNIQGLAKASIPNA